MPSRYVCSILDEMREAVKVLAINQIPGLIEEAQTAVNRMESKLTDYSNLKYDLKKWRGLKEEIRTLMTTKEWIGTELGLEDEPDPDNDTFDFE